MQQESDLDTLLLYQSKVAQLTEEINQLQTAKSRLEWITVGSKSYQMLKRYPACCLFTLLGRGTVVLEGLMLFVVLYYYFAPHLCCSVSGFATENCSLIVD